MYNQILLLKKSSGQEIFEELEKQKDDKEQQDLLFEGEKVDESCVHYFFYEKDMI